MKLSQRQIAALWIAEGGSPAKADLASSIFMAESNGDTQAGNYCCHGLCALNVEVGVASMSCALSPTCSIKKSIALSKNGKDWSPWEAYTNGHYTRFSGGGKVTSKQQVAKELAPLKSNKEFVGFSLGIPGLDPNLFGDGLEKLGIDPQGAAESLGKDALEGVVPGVGEISAFFTGAGELLLTPKGWLRIGKILGGAIFILWGINSLIKETAGVNPGGTVKKAAETAAVVATVK